MSISIEELLKGLQNPSKLELENSKDTWSRIGSRDRFSELGLDKSDLDDFLREWQESNPYNAI